MTGPSVAALPRNEQRRPARGGAASDCAYDNETKISLLTHESHASFAAAERAVAWLVRRGVRPLLAPTLAALAGLGGTPR
jgi:hypothetical protein